MKRISKYKVTDKKTFASGVAITAWGLLGFFVGVGLTVIELTSQQEEYVSGIAESVASPVLREVSADQLPNRVIRFASPNAEKCMALNIYHEARGEPFAGKVAVADVVLNRTKDSRSPDTICAVVYEGLRGISGKMYLTKCQFSWYCDGKSDEPTEDMAWQESLNIARQMLGKDNYYRGLTEGATHYHAYDITPPLWTKNIDVRMVGRIGDHIFYRWQ
jgi:spore germination cell wall hydrolase CwlJ-like protein